VARKGSQKKRFHGFYGKTVGDTCSGVHRWKEL